MRALIQRVSQAAVRVDDRVIGEIGPGLLIFICAMAGDDAARCRTLARKISRLRIFADATGRMNRALPDTGGAALVVSQFTLAADTGSGNRPGFSQAAAPDLARALYTRFIADLEDLGIATASGRFGADMAVSLINDGPVTLWLDV